MASIWGYSYAASLPVTNLAALTLMHDVCFDNREAIRYAEKLLAYRWIITW